MASLFGKLKVGTTGGSSPAANSSPSKKDPNAPVLTPLERMLLNAGPIRADGSDKFFGMENFGNTCYCNSILQALYYSVPFREHVLSYPQHSSPETLASAALTATPRPPFNPNANGAVKKPPASPANRNSATTAQPQKPEDKDSPEYKKKQALMAGPILNMSYQNTSGYNMSESLFTSLKDIFEAVVTNQSRNGVISPSKFLEVLRKENEMFRSAMHQDAHEFLNLLLNAVAEHIESYERKLNAEKEKAEATEKDQNRDASDETASNSTVQAEDSAIVSFPTLLPVPNNNSTSRWLQGLFEGTLTSETRCLTCENTSHRDEPFLDLSVDLEQHSSVTACLRRFSEEEMLCERNKFHCDNCGGLQEAEKRMKIKTLPRILALHLKRFKYTEDLQRLQKLFHKVVYPYHMRLFNTTDDAEDPDRMYELYAVVVHIGGGPYHGHYVAIIKTQDRGWLLFDDEMVEPVDKSYVRNFFGDRPGLACAYVLFYQETTLEAIQKEQRMEGKPRASEDAAVGLGLTTKHSSELHRVQSVGPGLLQREGAHLTSLDHAVSAPQLIDPNGHVPLPKSPLTTSAIRPTSPVVQSKKEKAKEEKERKAAEKLAGKEKTAADKHAEKEMQAAEKWKRKDLAAKLQDAYKKQETDLRAAMEASKASKVEEDKRHTGDIADAPKEKENSQANGVSPSGLDRFRRSKSLRFGSLTKKDKSEKPVSSPADEPTVSGSAIDDAPEKEKDKDADKDKEKRNRFSIRKKSFGLLSS